jgi:O-6-methylguanine DNA methyltransferase
MARIASQTMSSDRATGKSAALFPTALGHCGIAWTAKGISALLLPEADARETAARLLQGGRTLASPPLLVQQAITRLTAHLDGTSDDLRDVRLDLEHVTSFCRQTYRALRQVAPGRVTTYGALARRLRLPGASRAVGRAMATNPLPLLIPCHRVLAARDALGHFSAHGGNTTKLRLLTLEGFALDRFHRAGVSHLRRLSGPLASLIRRVGRYRLESTKTADPFTTLAKAIIHQQVSTAAGRTIFSRLIESCGNGRILAPERVRYASASTLRDAGVSRQKAGYLIDLAGRVGDGRLDLARLSTMDDESVITVLTQVRGIGRWSAEMFLMFHLGRLDVLPIDDLGLQRGYQGTFGLAGRPNKSEMVELASPWRPYRSIAAWYLWRSLEQAPGKA